MNFKGKTLKGILGVQIDNRNVLLALRLRTEHFKLVFVVKKAVKIEKKKNNTVNKYCKLYC